MSVSKAMRHGVVIAGVACIAALVAIVFRPPEMMHDALMHAGDEAIESVAVMPLENLSPDSAQDDFAERMTLDLITNLGKVSALRVISNKVTKESLPEIDVDGIVEGTVQRIGNRVRVTARLLRAPSKRQLWGATYERQSNDILALQDEVVGAITAQVRAVVKAEKKARD